MEEKIEKILLDLNIGYITVRVAKTKILKLIKNEEQKSKPQRQLGNAKRTL